MKIIRKDLIIDFIHKQANSRKALEAWVSIVERANWKTPQDIKNRFNSADFLSDNRVIFNIRGNNYRVVAQVRYALDTVIIDWIGTHAEYDKKTF